MISPSLHPDPVTARFQTRGRWAFGLTGRTVFLLLLGFLGIVPGFWDARLAYSMLAWDALVLLVALLDGLRLPAPPRWLPPALGPMRPHLIPIPRSN